MPWKTNCINVDKWPELKKPTKGSRDKRWLLGGQGTSESEIFLFKESHRRYPAEFWSEIVASEIAKMVGIPAPRTYCAKLKDTYGALVEFFLEIENKDVTEELKHGGDLVLIQHPSFDRRKGETHNIYFVEEVFGYLEKMDLFPDFLKIIVFDTIIGNTDRHQDNWGFIIKDDQIVRLAPAFDNSDSLGRELIEDKLIDFLHEDEVKLKQYLFKGKPHLRWSIDGEYLDWLNHFEFLDKVVQKWPETVNFVKEQTRFSDQQVDSVFDEVSKIQIDNPKYVLSKNRMKLMNKILCIRRNLLKQQFKV
ncbi:MAG: HipA domain-containing protein [Candidatus Anammoxibacter sp.]